MTPLPICFDATGTLIELSEGVGEVYHRVALEHGVDLPAWRLEDAFLRILPRAPARGLAGETVAARQQGEVDWWFERVRETFQATDSTARFADFPAFATALFDTYCSADAWRLRAGVYGMLTTLRDREWPMAVVSNFDHRLPKILEAIDISSFFKLVVVPSNLGSAKPERAIFEYVGQAFGTPVERLLYVGDDSRETLEAIAALGLRVFDVREIAELEDFPDLAATAATLLPR